MSYQSESSQYRHETLKYCVGNGIDLGSGGDPIKIDGCISFDKGGERQADLTNDDGVNFYGDAFNLGKYFMLDVFNYVYSSHLLEDFKLEDWPRILQKWINVLKPGGHLVLLVPDHVLYHKLTPVGANQNHQHEPVLGELTAFFKQHFPSMKIVEERLAIPEKYTIMFVAQKPL